MSYYISALFKCETRSFTLTIGFLAWLHPKPQVTRDGRWWQNWRYFKFIKLVLGTSCVFRDQDGRTGLLLVLLFFSGPYMAVLRSLLIFYTNKLLSYVFSLLREKKHTAMSSKTYITLKERSLQINASFTRLPYLSTDLRHVFFLSIREV